MRRENGHVVCQASSVNENSNILDRTCQMWMQFNSLPNLIFMKNVMNSRLMIFYTVTEFSLLGDTLDRQMFSTVD